MELVLGRARPTLDGNCCCLPLRAHLSVAIRQTPLLVRSSQKQCPQQIYIEFFSILSMRDEMYRGGMSERRRELPMSLMSFELGASSIAFALARGVKRIVGKWRGQDLRRRLLSSIGHAIGRAKGKKDSRLSGEPDLDAPAPEVPTPRWRGYLSGVLIAAACTALAATMSIWFAPTNLAMVYLLGVVLAATQLGRNAAIAASVVGTLAFDFFFIPPQYSFAISDTQYLITAIVLLTVGLVISSLASGLRLQAHAAMFRERHTAALYAMAGELATASSLDDIATSSLSHLGKIFDASGLILLKRPDGTMRSFGTDTLPAAEAIYLPLNGTLGKVGVLVIHGNRGPALVCEQQRLLEAFANQIAVAVERDELRRAAHASAYAAQEERLRSSLLSSISHDLRTPLAVIGGSASTLLQGNSQLAEGTPRQFVQTIHDEAQRMTHMVNNILDMTRLQSGPVRLDLQSYDLEEIVGAVLERLKDQFGQRVVSINIPHDLPMLHVDGVLFEKVLLNVLENAAKYTPPHSHIGIVASLRERQIEIQVTDDGPGIPNGSEHMVFAKFYRTHAQGDVKGTGLGLAICSAIIEAHGGRIWAENRPEGGAIFSLVLPLKAVRSERAERPVT
jgi:two-component system sensor histidine kinase KdpD